jgi:hypothetical protein
VVVVGVVVGLVVGVVLAVVVTGDGLCGDGHHQSQPFGGGGGAGLCDG